MKSLGNWWALNSTVLALHLRDRHVGGTLEMEVQMPRLEIDLNGLPDFPNRQEKPEPFNKVIAYWLSILCEMSYHTSSVIARTLRRMAFTDVAFFGFRGTYGFLATHRDHFSVLVFRGTMKDYKNLFTDFSFLTRPIPDMNMRAHGGFVTALSDVWGTCQFGTTSGISVKWVGSEGITNVLNKLCCSSRCYFTGHSLGGALATLAAMRLAEIKEYEDDSQAEITGSDNDGDWKPRIGQPQAIYTFGSPRVGCKDFAAKMKASGIASYRIVNSTDIIPELPLPFGFRHIDVPIYLTQEGTIRRSSTGRSWYRAWEFLKACPSLLSLIIPQTLVRDLEPAIFTNHRIANYRQRLQKLALEQVSTTFGYRPQRETDTNRGADLASAGT
jgi:hypothetical protein